MSGYRVRPARAGEVAALDAHIFPADARVDPMEGAWFVACALTPVAFGGVLVQGSDALFVRGGVRPTHRRSGLYKRLIRTCERYAKKLGAERIWTYVLPWNAGSINALIGCGWRAYERAGGEPDCLYMGKVL